MMAETQDRHGSILAMGMESLPTLDLHTTQIRQMSQVAMNLVLDIQMLTILTPMAILTLSLLLGGSVFYYSRAMVTVRFKRLSC